MAEETLAVIGLEAGEAASDGWLKRLEGAGRFVTQVAL